MFLEAPEEREKSPTCCANRGLRWGDGRAWGQPGAAGGKGTMRGPPISLDFFGPSVSVVKESNCFNLLKRGIKRKKPTNQPTPKQTNQKNHAHCGLECSLCPSVGAPRPLWAHSGQAAAEGDSRKSKAGCWALPLRSITDLNQGFVSYYLI